MVKNECNWIELKWMRTIAWNTIIECEVFFKGCKRLSFKTNCEVGRTWDFGLPASASRSYQVQPMWPSSPWWFSLVGPRWYLDHSAHSWSLWHTLSGRGRIDVRVPIIRWYWFTGNSSHKHSNGLKWKPSVDFKCVIWIHFRLISLFLLNFNLTI